MPKPNPHDRSRPGTPRDRDPTLGIEQAMSDAEEAEQAEVDFVDNENPFGEQARERLDPEYFFEEEYDGEQGPELGAMHETEEPERS